MAKAFEKALNDYLFNVEYGYAPGNKKDCKKKLLSLRKMSIGKIGNNTQKETFEMETLNKKSTRTR